MKRFKDFAEENIPSLSWGGHETIRNKIRKVKEKIPSLSWDGHHSLRNIITEEWTGNSGHSDGKHYHPDVVPTSVTAAHKKSIYDFTSGEADEHPGYSENVNPYLRNMAGDKTVGIHSNHSTRQVRAAVKALSSVFTKGNTNRIPIESSAGIPPHIGHKLMSSGINSQHHLAGFTSTSSDQGVAKAFAKGYPKDDSTKLEDHILHCQVEPHAGYAIPVNQSRFDEHEVLLHHGARITYHGTDSHREYLGTKDGIKLYKTTHVHRVTVHADHKPLEEYGSYRHPTTRKE